MDVWITLVAPTEYLRSWIVDIWCENEEHPAHGSKLLAVGAAVGQRAPGVGVRGESGSQRRR